jgi:transcription antitermination protein NusB
VAARTKARKRAVDVLYEAEARGVPATDVLAARIAAATPPVNDYTVSLVEGVLAQQERIDELLTTYAQGWSLERMPAVDRNILRVGTYELLWCEDIPDPVAVSEAVGLAQELSTEESPNFVNGLLGRLQQLKPTLTV